MAADQIDEDQRKRNTGYEAGSDKKEHFAHDHRDSIAPQRPERDANANFTGPPQHGVGHNENLDVNKQFREGQGD